MADTEETFEEPVTKFPTTMNMEGLKSKFFTNNMVGFSEEFSTDLAMGKLRVFDAVYKFSSDYEDRPQFVVNNLLAGFVKQLEDKRKYFFTVFRCVKNGACYDIGSIWITNCTLPMKEVISDKYDDFDWTEIDLNTTSVNQIVNNFMGNGDVTTVYLH